MYWSTKDNIEELKQELQQEGWSVEVAISTEAMVESCDLIITTTSSRKSLLHSPVSPTKPLLIICIGADSVGKQEISVDTVQTAGLLVCDSLAQTKERGEFQHAIREGRVTIDSIVEIGTVVANGNPTSNGTQAGALTIFDSSGVAIQDCVVAKMAYEELVG
mmetsp:Transcript_22838/g.32694  ORF Transcript_22838/g.32694 Transcript_22838/m.32694 type:complete len:162 (+) Transcript_22838:2-487(+)